jgi:hypothetical protein
MVTDPPQVAVTFPAMSVAVRFVICHFSSEQLEIFGSPFTVDDAQVPEKTELLEDDDEEDEEDDEEDEEEEDEDEDEPAPPPVEDAFVLDGAVGKSDSDLLWKPQAATSVEARSEAISAEFFISVPYTSVFALTFSCARTYENSSKCVKCLRSSGLVQNAGQCLNVYRSMVRVG